MSLACPNVKLQFRLRQQAAANLARCLTGHWAAPAAG